MMLMRKGLTNLREYLATEGKIELSLGCFDIPKMDLMSLSDPFCVAYVRNASDWEKIGSTETCQNSVACKWAWKLPIDEILACSEFKFEVYDRDSKRETLKDHDFIGSVEGKLISSMLEEGIAFKKHDIIRKDARKTSGMLSLTLDWIEKPLFNFDVSLNISVNCQLRKGLYYHLMRSCSHSPQYILVQRSSVLDKKGCCFEETKVSLMQLGSTSRSLRIAVFRMQQFGKDKFLGYIKTSVDELLHSDLNTPLSWTPSEDGSLRTPRVSVSPGADTTETHKHFFIHISDQ